MSAALIDEIGEEYRRAALRAGFFNVNEERTIRRFEQRENLPKGHPETSCDTNLFFGFFFDGTRNNYKAAEKTGEHSNVARLYDIYPGQGVRGVVPDSANHVFDQSTYPHFFKVYIPGVASEFEQIGDSGQGDDQTFGGAVGRLAERRIVWALSQAINNVHRFFYKAPLVSDHDIKILASQISLTKLSRRLMTGPMQESEKSLRQTSVAFNSTSSPRKHFQTLLTKLHAQVKPHWPTENGRPAKIDPGVVRTIYISIFGFSRGATQARVFANWLQSLCKLDAQLRNAQGMTLGGFPVQFDFMGIFDTVASVGAGNLFGNFALGSLLDGHSAWADAEESLRIPDGLKCLHLVAAHEGRRCFPLDSVSVKGVTPSHCTEIVVPGVHSDVGGGYAPREQGRGQHADGSDMLSRIPLLLMYKAARLNGVPLKLDLANETAKKRFDIDARTITTFNAYIAESKVKAGPVGTIIRDQMRRHMEWRVYRSVNGPAPLQNTESFLRASTFHQNDLHSAGVEFVDEVKRFSAWLNEKGPDYRPTTQPAGFGNDRESEWEEIATWWRENRKPSSGTCRFFDELVHDSRASFKLSGPDSESLLRKEFAKWAQTMKATQFDVLALQAKDGLTAERRRAVTEYLKTNEIPRYLNSGREPCHAPVWAGYLRYRKIYAGADDAFIA